LVVCSHFGSIDVFIINAMLLITMKKKLILTFIFITVLILITYPIYAQCPMCRISAETNMANGGDEGRGLNTGILYLLSLPYLLIFGLGYVWYRNRKKVENTETAN